MAKSTTRIIVKDSDTIRIDRIKELTGLSSGSEIISLILNKYSDHFEESFKVKACHCLETPPSPAILQGRGYANAQAAPQEPQEFQAFEL